MSIGPVEILVIGFPGNKFTGEVAPALADLVEAGLIRVIDLVFITKDADGDVAALELSELDETTGAAYRQHVEEPSGMLSEEDIEDLGAELEPNSSAAILLFEHVWATKFRDAVVDAGGELIASIRIPQDVVDEVLAAAEPGHEPRYHRATEQREEATMLRRGRPILRTAAVVGTATAVSGGVHHHQQQKWATRRPREAQQYAPAAPAVRAAAGAGRTGHHRGADQARAAALPGDPHRRGVRGQEGPDPRHLRSATGTAARRSAADHPSRR